MNNKSNAKAVLQVFFIIFLTSPTLFGQKHIVFSAQLEENIAILLNGKTMKTRKFKFIHKNKLLLEKTLQNLKEISLPLPDGTQEIFKLESTKILPDELASRYPIIQTFRGKSLSSNKMVRLNYGYTGLHACIFEKDKRSFIEPFENGYITYFAQDVDNEENIKLSCGSKPDFRNKMDYPLLQRSLADSNEVLTYRMALACTGEYGQRHGGTRETVLSHLAGIVNRINDIYERELSIRFILAENNDLLINLDGKSDDFENGNARDMLTKNPAFINSKISISSYDIGHILGTVESGNGVLGVASVASVCDVDTKATAASNQPKNYPDDAFVIEILCHEIGHQLGASHTFSNCYAENTPNTSFEPSCGTTIMSYGFQQQDYFHVASLQQITAFLRQSTGYTCATKEQIANTPPIIAPTIFLENEIYIPIRTPFSLTATAKDAENDNLTYCWEQYDREMVSEKNIVTGNVPLFRSYSPNTNNTRYFPKLSAILSNEPSEGEILPTTSRNLNFKLTVRDNHEGGGAIATQSIRFKSTDTAGPFQVIAPNLSITKQVGEYLEVRWEVANTNNDLVKCSFVNILLSIDGGQTFSIKLATNTPNDGAEFVLLPNVETDKARIKIEAVNHIFFAINKQIFAIKTAQKPTFSFAVVNAQARRTVCFSQQVKIELHTVAIKNFENSIKYTIVEGLPSRAAATFSNNPALPFEKSFLTLYLDKIDKTTNADIKIRATAQDSDTLLITIPLTIIPNNSSAIVIIAPFDGLANMPIQSVPNFSWKGTPSASSYTFKLDVTPAFNGKNLYIKKDITSTSFSLSTHFEEKRIYYWQIIPINACGEGEPSPISTFQTAATTSCAKFNNNNIYTISNYGTQIIESPIIVNSKHAISSINIPKIKGKHERFSDLEGSLISPEGTEIKLFSALCGIFNGDFNLAFDDQSISQVLCPPTDGYFAKPLQRIGILNGENMQGIWRLRLKDRLDNDGGSLNGWELQLCTNNISLHPPSMVKNDTLRVRAKSYKTLTNKELWIKDDENTAQQLQFTIINSPQNGYLLLNNEKIKTGSIFFQSDIDAQHLQYWHTGKDTNKYDSFTYIVEDDNGGWLAPKRFPIQIDSRTTAQDIEKNEDFEIFPNPNNGRFYLKNITANEVLVAYSLWDIKGQMLRQHSVETQNDYLQSIDLENIPNGIFLLKIQTKKGIHVKKLVIQ